ncbi:MAG: hypothetical protein GF364_15460 [Candidatus Lokiarchaeota archaeon]|nr:hypothetical protein [Candidatus Lokiarchaeota archaeon]
MISQILLGEDPQRDQIRKDVASLVKIMRNYTKNNKEITKQILEFLGEDFRFIYFLSRGASLSAAYQAAFAAKSYGRLYAEGLSIGLFFHGPFQIADENFRCIFFIGDDYTEQSEDILPRLINLTTKKFGSGKTVLINNNKTLAEKVKDNPNVLLIEYEYSNTALSPIYQMFTSMLTFMDIALKRGLIMFL